MPTLAFRPFGGMQVESRLTGAEQGRCGGLAFEESSPKRLGDFADALDWADEEVEAVFIGPLDEFDVVLRADVQASEDCRQVFGDTAAFSRRDAAAGPIDQFDVILKTGRQCDLAVGVLVPEPHQFAHRGVQILGEFGFGFRLLIRAGHAAFENPLLDRGEVGFLRRLGHCCSDWVQIDIGHRRDDGRFVQQRLALEPRLPKVAGDVVFLVGSSGNGFIQATHEPGDIEQSFSIGGDEVQDDGELAFFELFAFGELADQRLVVEKPAPAPRNLENHGVRSCMLLAPGKAWRRGIWKLAN